MMCSFESILQAATIWTLKAWKKFPLWKVSYEECSLFETSTTQMPILSRIKSLAVHINTFQAQIKKCKQNKKIYIYIIFPLSKGFKSQCSKSFNTESEEHTVQSWDKQVPAKATALTRGVGTMDGIEWAELRKRAWGEWTRVGTGMRWGRWGSWDIHMVKLVDFIYWFLTFSFWFFVLISPLPRSNNGRNPPQQWMEPY